MTKVTYTNFWTQLRLGKFTSEFSFQCIQWKLKFWNCEQVQMKNKETNKMLRFILSGSYMSAANVISMTYQKTFSNLYHSICANSVSFSQGAVVRVTIPFTYLYFEGTHKWHYKIRKRQQQVEVAKMIPFKWMTYSFLKQTEPLWFILRRLHC